ncbi:hypothetical protein [Gillisia sp. CAL575]|uniref:hypothetical protein n=1 Tax=Gillisia sp. CAL575 TaxID=985255 RepID=UPI00039CB508|nr:hypothetical protein [Gillisia sp. CAL575]
MKAIIIFRNIKIYKLSFLLCLFFTSCSSINLVEQYTNPVIQNTNIRKVLVIGMTPNNDIRRIFEKKVANELSKQNLIAVKSFDFFEKSFTEIQKSEEQLNQIQAQLIEANFDAILLAKVTGQEEKIALTQSYNDILRDFDSFKDDYYSNQGIYASQESESYVLYHTETSLYCLCPAAQRQILYKASIDIVDTKPIEKNINDYIKVLFKNLKDNKIFSR